MGYIAPAVEGNVNMFHELAGVSAHSRGIREIDCFSVMEIRRGLVLGRSS